MQKEFENIFKHYFAPVKSFIKKLVKSDDDAEDLTQELFTRLWVKHDVWHDNPDIDRYIFRMAKYMALTALRNNARDISEGWIDADISLVEKVGDDICTSDAIIHAEANLLLQMALEKMPEKRRTIFSLSRFEQLSHKEIAEKLNLSIRTVESHIYSALMTLKEIFPRHNNRPADKKAETVSDRCDN